MNDLVDPLFSANVENSNKAKINLRFFLTFIGAVAYIQETLWDDFIELDYISEVEPGMHTTKCQRAWMVGGIKLDDEVIFPMDNQLYISGLVGHKQDFSTLIVWGKYEDEIEGNPRVGSYWQTEMMIWKLPNPNYYLENSQPISTFRGSGSSSS